MELFERAFRLLPDTVIITDLYWYILDYNHAEAIKELRKGVNLTRIIRDCKDTAKGKFRYNEIIFQRTTTPVYDKEIHVGYVVYLANITERETLIQQRLQKNAELEALIREQARANAELEDYLHQAEALVGYEEQLRIARSIHDDAGHAITELNTISQMCLQLRETDPEHYRQLISQGIELCKRSMKEEKSDQFTSLREMLEQFRDGCEIPVDLLIAGEEPAFAGRLYSVIGTICKEAYHNTLSHSLADRMKIELHMAPEQLMLRIEDNGKFHGRLEKGFGLTTMEENVKASGGTITFCAEEDRGFGIQAEWRNEQ